MSYTLQAVLEASLPNTQIAKLRAQPAIATQLIRHLTSPGASSNDSRPARIEVGPAEQCVTAPYTYLQASTCTAPDGSSVTYARYCARVPPAAEAPRMPGWRPAVCTSEQLAQSGWTPSADPTAVDPQPPAEVKAETVKKSWFRENWKWVTGLAVVGGGVYWWMAFRSLSRRA